MSDEECRAGLPPLSTRGGCSSPHRQETHSHGGWPLCSALRGRGRRLRIRSSGDRAGGGKSDKGARQPKSEGLQQEPKGTCDPASNRFNQIMIAMLVDPLPVSFENFAAVSGTLPDRDSVIVRTCQNATRPQPTTAQGRRLSPPVSARLCAAADPQSLLASAANIADGAPFTQTSRKLSPVDTILDDLIPNRHCSMRNSRSGAPSSATRLTSSCATRVEP
jgi:hypothetical protein